MKLHMFFGILIPILGSSIPLGFGFGVMNLPQKVIRMWINETIISRYEVTLTEHEEVMLWGFIVTIFYVCSMLGSIYSNHIITRFGRRRVFLANHITSLIGNILFVVSKICMSVELLAVGRLILGLSGGLSMSLVPLYLSEIAPDSNKGCVAIVYVIGFIIGIDMSQILGMNVILGTADHWNYITSIPAACSAMAILLHPLLLESPVFYFQIIKDNVKGQLVLNLLHDDESVVTREMMNLKSELETLDKEHETQSIMHRLRIIFNSANRLNTIIMIVIYAVQPLAGLIGLLSYSSIIFTSAGLTQIQSELASISATFLNLISCIASIFILKKFKRRIILLSSLAGCAICLSIKMLCLMEDHYHTNITLFLKFNIGYANIYISILCFILWFIFFGYGIGALPYVLLTELNLGTLRSEVMSISTASYCFFTILIGFFFPLMQHELGELSLLFFILPTIFAAIFFYMYLPETFEMERVYIRDRKISKLSVQDGITIIYNDFHKCVTKV